MVFVDYHFKLWCGGVLKISLTMNDVKCMIQLLMNMIDTFKAQTIHCIVCVCVHVCVCTCACTCAYMYM